MKPKQEAKQRVAALDLTDSEAQAMGFYDAAHYRIAGDKLIEFFDALILPDGRTAPAALRAMLSIQIAAFADCILANTSNEDEKTKLRKSLLSDFLGIVVRALGGELEGVAFQPITEEAPPLPPVEKKGDPSGTIH
jgi:hypothetical protein